MKYTIHSSGMVAFRKRASGGGTASVEYLLLRAGYGSRHWVLPKYQVDDPLEDDMLQVAFEAVEDKCGLAANVDYWIPERFNAEEAAVEPVSHDVCYTGKSSFIKLYILKVSSFFVYNTSEHNGLNVLVFCLIAKMGFIIKTIWRIEVKY